MKMKVKMISNKQNKKITITVIFYKILALIKFNNLKIRTLIKKLLLIIKSHILIKNHHMKQLQKPTQN